jgi:hypothetical protein
MRAPWHKLYDEFVNRIEFKYSVFGSDENEDEGIVRAGVISAPAFMIYDGAKLVKVAHNISGESDLRELIEEAIDEAV